MKNSKLDNKNEFSRKVWSNRDKLFTDLHNAIIELAMEYPDIDFIIKPKKVMIKNKSWNFYKEVIKKSKINIENLPNYKVDANLDVGKGIFASSVICALQSSVVLESSLANKRVIFPLFYDFLSTSYSNDFFWRDDTKLFDIATDKSEFKKMFRNILDSPDIPKDIQCQRKKLFEKWFDSSNGGSLDKYFKIIKNVV